MSADSGPRGTKGSDGLWDMTKSEVIDVARQRENTIKTLRRIAKAAQRALLAYDEEYLAPGSDLDERVREWEATDGR